jgi:hypothetical protein
LRRRRILHCSSIIHSTAFLYFIPVQRNAAVALSNVEAALEAVDFEASEKAVTAVEVEVGSEF